MFGTELATEAYRLLMEVLGTAATLRQDSPGALVRGRVERMHRACLILTFGGGTNEVQRDIIGMVALGTAPSQPLTLPVGDEYSWISRQPKRHRTSAVWSTPSSTRCALPNTSANWTGSTIGSTANCGASSSTADILTSAAATQVGGDGFGVLEQVAILVALGHQLAAVPYLESVVLGAGSAGPVRLRGAAAELGLRRCNGEKILTVALDGEMGDGSVQATRAGDGYRLTGSRTQVVLRSRRGRFPGARRNRFRHSGFPGCRR